MKKLGIVVVLALATAGIVFAQGVPFPFGYRAYPQAATPTVQTVKIEGKLALINGIVGLKSGDKTYYLPMLGRLSGFVEGIKEGASVKVEGYEYPLATTPATSTVQVTKLNVGGKDYDLGQAAGYGYGYNYGRNGGWAMGHRW